MTELKDILGINARNRLFLPYNTHVGRVIADSKLLTKKQMKRIGIPVPALYAVFENLDQVKSYHWEKLGGNFVIKPTRGYAGEGIVMIRKRGQWAGEWILMDNSKVTTADLQLHVADIFAGRYSLKNTPDKAFVEERIKIHPIFKRYTYQGTPDIRVIVFNQVPVMAMLRIPTQESRGRANLHQGAIGAGIDLATGITTYGVCYSRLIKHIPHTGRKINGLKLPYWDEILLLSSKIQRELPKLGYLGIDFILDRERGPMVLELNARPGLSIQICNRAGLYRRLQRVQGLEVRDSRHAARIAKSLFSERFADRVAAEKGIKTLNVLETVGIRVGRKDWVEVKAKIDTGAFRSSIDRSLAQKLGLLEKKNVLYSRHYRSSMGKSLERKVIEVGLRIAGRKIKTAVSVVDRSHMNTPLLVGRRDLTGFLVRPEPVTTGPSEQASVEKELSPSPKEEK